MYLRIQRPSRGGGIENELIELGYISVVSGCALDPLKHFFSSHIPRVCDKVNQFHNINEVIRADILENLLRMTKVAIKEGISRMKIFVIYLPKIIDNIIAYSGVTPNTASTGEEGMQREGEGANAKEGAGCSKEEEERNVELFISILNQIIDSILQSSQRGRNCEFFLNFIEVLLELAPSNKETIDLLKKIPEKFEINGSYFSLLDFQFAYQIACSLPDVGKKHVANRCYLIMKNSQRRHIRLFWNICKSRQFTRSPTYSVFHPILFLPNQQCVIFFLSSSHFFPFSNYLFLDEDPTSLFSAFSLLLFLQFPVAVSFAWPSNFPNNEGIIVWVRQVILASILQYLPLPFLAFPFPSCVYYDQAW